MNRTDTNNFLFSIQQYTTFTFLLLFSFFLFNLCCNAYIEFYGVNLCEIVTRERWNKQWCNLKRTAFGIIFQNNNQGR